jgi:tetratricopeptide (TPR) repeat protein
LRQAIECDSTDFDNYFILALVYFQMNDIKSSADTFRKAVAIDPKNLGARMNLAVMLKKLGDYKGVEQVLRDTVALNPKYSFGHLELGKFLAEVGDNNGAINAFRDAIAINSKSADAHSQLGLALRNTGEYEKALESFRTAAILSPEKSPGQDNARQNIKVAERMRELEKAIPDVLAGKQLVGDDGPLLLAVCLQTKRYASAVEIYKLVLAKLPKLADNPASAHRYNAACAAVLAANGKGRDSATLSAEQKGHLRREALTWLKADLEAWSKLVKTNKPEQAKLVEGQMRHWLEDGDLESVRNPESLKSLPESERQEWQKLWQGVRELSGLAKEPKK